METLRVGDLAYYDSFAGLIPCKVTGIIVPRDKQGSMASSQDCVTVRFTANHGRFNTWKRGEVLTTSGLHVIPRKAVRHSKYGTKIRAYQVQA